MQCRHCKTKLQAERHGTFCSASCRATFTNLLRPRSEATNEKISEGLRRTKQAKRDLGTKGFPVRFDRIEHPFSRLFINTCKHCDNKFTSRIKRKFCDEHVMLYERGNRSRFEFTFRLEHYPLLFNMEQIRSIGLYHPKKNVNGLSRDHRVSINEAFKNNYDPFYIKHPLNCEIMTQRANSSKKGNSSIRYEELKRLVDACRLAPVPGFEPGFTD